MTDFAATKAMFDLPEGMIYLDGNSLGPLPKSAPARLDGMLKDEWGKMLITGWNKAGWMAQPMTIGDRVGAMIGAEAGHVVMGDTLTITLECAPGQLSAPQALSLIGGFAGRLAEPLRHLL